VSNEEDGTKRRILDAAGAIFAEHGFERATIREISAAAKVNLAAVNYHFGDKERLYAAVIRDAHETAASQVPLPNWNGETSPEQKLRDFIRMMLQRMLVVQRLPWQSRLMMREFIQPTGACQGLVEEYVRPHFRILLGILGELLPTEAPQHRRYQIAFSVVGQCVFYKMNAPVIEMLLPEEERATYFSAEQLAEHIADFTLAALCHGSALGQRRNGKPAACDREIQSGDQARRER
jgi:TetR/AcrR family transcriptional regulator, regulator of cefoperazone and chloramphenicol sensitivity